MGSSSRLDLSLGSLPDAEGGYKFHVWAQHAKQVHLEISDGLETYALEMQSNDQGIYTLHIPNLTPKAQYYYVLDGRHRLPDPASRYQPKGIHGPSQVVNLYQFAWQDNDWQGLAREEYIIYEIKVDRFTIEGSYLAIIPFLQELKTLGITAIQLSMPPILGSDINSLPLFSIVSPFGTPHHLQMLTNACHQLNIAVIMSLDLQRTADASHLFNTYGPYFLSPTQNYINLNQAYSHFVRRYFIENILHWFIEYHIDAINFENMDCLIENSPYPFLNELTDHIQQLSYALQKPLFLFIESELNNPNLLMPRFKGGKEFHAHRNNDFHYSLYALLTHYRENKYQDFGQLKQFVKAYCEGFVYSGEYSHFYKKPHGQSSKCIPGEQFIVPLLHKDFLMQADISSPLNFAQLKLAIGLQLLSPYLPAISMGEEFAHFKQDIYIAHTTKFENEQYVIRDYYQYLINVRKRNNCFNVLDKQAINIETDFKKNILIIERVQTAERVLMICNFNALPIKLTLAPPAGNWNKIFDSEDKKWLGTHSAHVQISENEFLMPLAPFHLLIYAENQ